MKQKISTVILGLSVCATLFTACEKKNPKQTENTTPVNSVNDEVKQLNTLSKGAFNSEYLKSTRRCSNRVIKDCVILQEIVIVVSQRTILVGACQDNPAEVQEALLNPEMRNVAENLPTEVLEKLTSGSYYLKVAYEDSRTIGFVSGRTYPVTDSNIEFAFELTKQ